METIIKRISLEDARIRLRCNIPTIGVSEDSLGKIYSDISGSSKYIRTKTIARRYVKLLDIVRDGIKLKRKSNISDCAGSGSESRYVINDNFEIMPLTCGSNDLGYEVYNTNAFERISETEYETNLPITADVVVLTDDFDEFERLGGTDEIVKIYKYLYCGEKDGGVYVTPYIETTILLTQDFSDIGHMTDYQDELNDFPNEDGIAIDTAEYDENDNKHSKQDIPNPLVCGTTENITGYTTDSKLQTLRSKRLYTDDEGNLLPGVYSEVSANTFWRYTYNKNAGTFSISKINDARNYPCGEGEPLIANERKYRIATIPETAKRLIIDNDAPSGSYYFLVKYQNSSARPMTIPFEVGNGITEIDKTTNPGYITITYEVNGVTYKEEYKYNTGQTMNINLDGFENIKIYYDEIDYEFTQQTIYNKHYDLYRDANLAEIEEYITGDVWGKYNSATTINAPVFKEEYLLGVSTAFKSDVNVTISRGNAAAFEKHFKLMECNTYEDLENISNNIFNL